MLISTGLSLGTAAGISNGASGGFSLNRPDLQSHLQLWLRADRLALKDGTEVYRWPDESGGRRDAFPTLGMFEGAGRPPQFIKASQLNGRPAVRFQKESGLGTPGDLPPDIVGDSPYTLIVVARLQHQDGPGRDVIAGFGEFYDATNTSAGRPSAGLLEIDRTPEGRHRLDHAGGFNRNALLGRPGSFASFYDQPVVMVLIKTPGSMRTESRLYLNGAEIDQTPASGTTATSDIRHRKDFGIILGHAHAFTGSLLGDIGEVILLNIALDAPQRRAIEQDLAARYAIVPEQEEPEPSVTHWSDRQRAHWAFQPLAESPHSGPDGRPSTGGSTIDDFLLQRLQAHDLEFSPAADRPTLVRRLYLDLIGLPPTPDESAAAERDPRPAAYEALVDHLLASPHFGERWGRHWLDLVGYVDVTGNDQNAEQIILGPSKWRYRDYVIQSFNADKAWDQFLTEQLAGDEMFDWRNAETFTEDQRRTLIATGYLRTAIDDTHEVDLNKVPFRYQVVYDTVQIIGSSLFGLTLQCARCHDHKYDPVTQKDYYSLMALFTPALNPYAWLQPKDRELPDVPPKQQASFQKHNAEIDRQREGLMEQIRSLEETATNRLLSLRLEGLGAETRSNVQTALLERAEKRSETQKTILKEHESKLKWSPEDLQAVLDPEQRAELTRLKTEEQRLKAERRKWEPIRAFFESGPPPRDYVFQRGDYERRGRRVRPAVLSILHRPDEPAELPASPAPASLFTSGRRLAFARWLTDPKGRAAALHARVVVNRFWQQLFGEGLVPTPESFGLNGLAPTHPELLEFLARRFIAGGWRVKPLLKEMLLSQAYRQGSQTGIPGQASPKETALARDPDNRLLWRQRLRRLESEVVRDSILAASGKLDRSAFGPAVPLINLPDGSAALPADDQLPTPTSKWRRTVYLMGRRNFHLPILGSFDQPILNTSCTRRLAASVVLQPLTMLNDPFVIEQARFIAERARQGGTPGEGAIELAFRLVLGRVPSTDEVHWSRSFLEEHRRLLTQEKVPADQAPLQAFAVLCQLLLNTSEFLYLN